MNLISCNQCGVVINKDRLSFPDIYDHDRMELIEGTYKWNGENETAYVECPVCGEPILEEEG